MRRITTLIFLITMMATMVLSACTGSGAVSSTPVPSVEPSQTPIPPTPTPIPSVLNVCIGQEPESLYLYSGTRNQSTWSVLEGLYDGPIDYVKYEYIPVILTKIPSLQEGDAQILTVNVKQGMYVVDAEGVMRALQKGVKYLPAGCTSADCVVEYPGTGEVTMDQLVVKYQIREGINWSDGTPLKSSDSVFSFKLAGSQSYTGNKDLIHKTESYIALDEKTTQWTGLPGFRDQQYMTHFWIPQPEHIFSGKTPESIASDPMATEKPIGWGPFTVSEWVAGDHITLQKNPVYFRASEGLPRVDYVNFRFLKTTPEQSIEALLTKECDVVDESTLFDAQIATILQLQDAGKLKALLTPSPVWEALYFGISPASYDDGYLPGMGDRQDLFGDARTRRALAMCVDREKIIQEYWSGTSMIPVSMIDRTNPISLGVDKLIPYDPVQANALLDEIGWKDMDQNPATPRVAVNIPTVFLGTPLQFTLYTTNAELRKSVGNRIVSDLAACGVSVTMKDYSPEDLFANGPEGPLFGRNFDSTTLSWSPSTMPACQFFSSSHIPSNGNAWYGENIGGFSNKAYDDACLTASSVLPSEEKYVETQQAVQAIFMEQLPVIPLYQYVRIGLSQPGLCGYQMDATSRSSLWNLENMGTGSVCSD